MGKPVLLLWYTFVCVIYGNVAFQKFVQSTNNGADAFEMSVRDPEGNFHRLMMSHSASLSHNKVF